MIQDYFEIKKWLLQQGIKNFFIDQNGVVDVYQTTSIYVSNQPHLPIQFGKVQGDFSVVKSSITSLKGFPRKVTGSVLAYCNKIKSLKGTPSHIDGDFLLSTNKIKFLDDCPKFIGKNLELSNNPLKSLEGLTQNIGGGLSIVKTHVRDFNGVTADNQIRGRIYTDFCDNTKAEILFIEEKKKCEHTFIIDSTYDAIQKLPKKEKTRIS